MCYGKSVTVLVDGFEHRTGEHCASTAFRNVLRYHGLDLSESMIFGLAGGLGFFYIENDELSPARMFHGRSLTLEWDLCTNAALPVSADVDADDAHAEQYLIECLEAGWPVVLSTDTFYLDYQNTSSHFPGHRAVVVGYDQDGFWMADRKLNEYQRVTAAELRQARNAGDYAMSCANEFHHFRGPLELGRPLAEAIRIALQRNAKSMLEGSGETFAGAASGIPAMRRLVEQLPGWAERDDWSWCSRFGYQVIIKRGAGGRFFRSLYRDFLGEAAALVPALSAAGLEARTAAIAERWADLAALLKEQSERDTCAPKLFERSAAVLDELAGREQSLFEDIRGIAADASVWPSAC